MKNRKIVITGGPGTGKSSIIHKLEENGEKCLHEISRQVTLEAQSSGIDQLFLTQPLLFSEKLLDGRLKQYIEASGFKSDHIFIDRGLPDVVAYMDYFETEYPEVFNKTCENNRYDQIFILPPWKDIYTSDNERYESFDEALKISSYLYSTYKRYGYKPIEVPKLSVEDRTNFILDKI
ncbi:AAA family ATPase [Christiangramia forsetii]|uniref:ATPase-like protein n=2 Tax=Christiangramia forsetii TaxID=411153 RepID=A0M1C4_CHRFK|nr:ATP-binding protein [Christiangramia forsetii]GGG42868.1 ATPase [Christiangramia forsetii]CAL66419.1 ATPase-like protein [Christiangramia forsetii KT0803]